MSECPAVLDHAAGQAQTAGLGQGCFTVWHEGLSLGVDVAIHTEPEGPHLYHVTDAGLADFRAWMGSPLMTQRQRDPAYLKAAYFDFADPASVREQLRQQQAYWEAQLSMLEGTWAALVDRTHPTLAARLSKLTEREAEFAVRHKVYAYDGLIARARTELAWIADGFALVDELYDS